MVRDNNKKKKKKKGRSNGFERIQRIETNLAAANELENPLEGLEAFLTMDLKPKQSSKTASSSPSSVAHATEEDESRPAPAARLKIQYYASPLPDDLHKACMDLFEQNMGDMYRASQWGLDLTDKSNEFRHEHARFLVATAADEDDSTSSDKRSGVLSFAHFRFDVNDDNFPTEEVLYVYELQVSPKVHRCGLGRRLMAIMELVAMRTEMRKVMLTVFKTNEMAMQFYQTKMKYNIDEISPSQYTQAIDEKGEGDDTADYEILSKSVWKG